MPKVKETLRVVSMLMLKGTLLLLLAMILIPKVDIQKQAVLHLMQVDYIQKQHRKHKRQLVNIMKLMMMLYLLSVMELQRMLVVMHLL